MSSCYVELREPREVSFLRARAMEAGYRIVPKSANFDNTLLTDKDKKTDSSPEPEKQLKSRRVSF